MPNNDVGIGLTSHQGAITGALANLGMAAGRPIVGYFSDLIGTVNVASGATFSVQDLLLLDMDVCIYLRRTAGIHCPSWDHMWYLSSGTLSIPHVGSARRTNQCGDRRLSGPY